METNRRKSKFYRYIQTWILVTLFSIVNANAGDIHSSGFNNRKSTKFFVLTDTTYSPNEIAKIRLEYRYDDSFVKEYGGADIGIYKVKDPISFLKSQGSLHRIETYYNYKPKAGALNAIRYVWDSLYKKSRLVWQRVLSLNARVSAIKTSKKFRQKPGHEYKTKFVNYKQFGPIKGYKLLNEFKYPIGDAKPIKHANVKLSGSSHNWRESKGNVHIPLGKLKAGLYLVEAVIGTQRASTIVFVSDSILISKTSKENIFLWSVNKTTGKPVGKSTILLSDGIGVIKKGVTNEKGILKFNIKTPEQSYIIGRDKDGGVFVSENYYYDSEIYSSKIYTFTDRPLYRPGDNVHVKVIGRRFKNSSTSSWLKSKKYSASIIDSSGTVLLVKKFKVSKKSVGGEFSFRLPKFAIPGGYTILIKDKLNVFSSEFRVSKYSKPHYSIDVLFSKKKYRLKEKINGQIKLQYTNGKGVKGAKVEIVVRRQKLNVIEGERDAESLFPIVVEEIKAESNDKGIVEFKLPEVNLPSRYVINIKSKDSASYSIRASKELIIELDTPTFKIESDSLFSEVKANVEFRLKENLSLVKKSKTKILKWKSIHLESKKETSEEIEGKKFNIAFEKAGTYKVIILNENGEVVGGKTHIVRGKDFETLAGTVKIVFDKEQYRINDTVKALIHFSEPVEEALLTLERDKVEAYSISGKEDKWIKVEKKSDKQWIAYIPVKKLHAPNITFSVLFVRNGKYVFNNKGIKVNIPTIDITYKLDKLDYQVGEIAEVELLTTYLGKPISSNVTFSVVDEMIYVLQPEITPNIRDFFYHRRRNQVRTNSSLNFHVYDSSVSPLWGSRFGSNYSNRPLKLRERARREDVDTAIWKTNLITNTNGRIKIKFKIPDSITRWRLTARAINENGDVGQKVAHIKSTQDVYLKWGGLSEFRKGDEALANVMAFNLENIELKGKLSVNSISNKSSSSVNLKPGINHNFIKLVSNSDENIELKVEGSDFKDKLEKKINVRPVNWSSVKSKIITLKKGDNKIDLPKNAFNFTIVNSNDLYHDFIDAVSRLVQYPHGCVEQTSSKLIPLSMAYNVLSRSKIDKKRLKKIENMVVNGREHLVSMANKNGFFGWYEGMNNNSFMTAYAYLADFYASEVLSITHSKEHWKKVAEAFRKYPSSNVLKNSIILWILSHMGEATQSMLENELNNIEEVLKNKKVLPLNRNKNYIMLKSNGREHYLISVLILNSANRKLKSNGFSISKDLLRKLNDLKEKSIEELSHHKSPLVSAALINANEKIAKNKLVDQTLDVLRTLNDSHSTADRSFALILLNEKLNLFEYDDKAFKLSGKVKKIKSIFNLDTWQVLGNGEVSVSSDVEREKFEFKLYYETYEKDEHKLDVDIKRKIYSLEKKENNYLATYNDLSLPLKVDSKYVDEITLTPQIGKEFKYGMIEVPLPPGGSVNNDLGQIQIIQVSESGSEKTLYMNEVARKGDLTYKIPVKNLKDIVIFRHILNFDAKGKFKLPMARFFEMYEPAEKAYQNNNEEAFWELSIE